MNKYKTVKTNKYVDVEPKSMVIEKKAMSTPVQNEYFQKVINPIIEKSNNLTIQKSKNFWEDIINAFNKLNPEDATKLMRDILGNADSAISNLGTDALRMVNRGAYHGVDALENMRLLNRTVADNRRFGILAAAAQEGLPTEELRGKAFEDLKRLYSQKYPNNKWDAFKKDPENIAFQDPWFARRKPSTDKNHPISGMRDRYIEGRNRLGTGLGIGLGLGGETLINQSFNDNQKMPYKINFDKSMSKQKSVNKRSSVRKGDYASGLFNDGNGSGMQYDGQKKPSKIHYDGQPMPSNDESEIQYDGQRKPSEIHYDGQPRPIKNQYDRQKMPSSILSQVMPQSGPNILSQLMPQNGSNILSQLMPEDFSNILSQYMPENRSNIATNGLPSNWSEILSQLSLPSDDSNIGGINPRGIRYSNMRRRKKIQDAANGELPKNWVEILSQLSLPSDETDFNSESEKGSTMKRAVKKRGSVRKGDYASGLFNGGNGSGVKRAPYDDYKITPEFRPDQRRDAPFISPQRPSNFGFESMPGSEIYRYPMGYGLENEGEIGAVKRGYNPAENAVRQSMPSYWDVSEDTQGNTNEELMEALKTYAGKTFNNTKPFLDASLFNSDAWNRNFTKPLTNSFYSGIVDPLDAWLRSQNSSKNTNLGKRMSKRMNKKMDEDMAVTPRKVSTNRSIKSSNKYFK